MRGKTWLEILGGTLGLLVLGFFIVVLFFNPFITIQTGYEGVVLTWGKVTDTMDPGLHTRIPLMQSVVPLETRTKTVSFDSSNKTDDSLAAASKDLQDVAISVVTNYHIDKSKVVDIFTNYRTEYESSIVAPIIRETIKSTSAEYTAEELVTKRSEFSDKAARRLADTLGSKGIVLDRVNIVNLKFSDSFSKAIEDKVSAEQKALTAKNTLDQVNFEAQQTVSRAKAEAEAIKIQAEAITQQGGADYVMLQAIKTWDGHGCTSSCFGQGTQMPIPLFNIK